MEDVSLMGKIQKERFPNLDTDKVIITDRQRRHINERHHGDFDAYREWIPEILESPEHILEDRKRPNDTAILLKSFPADTGKLYFYLCLRLHTPESPPEYCNSIITFWRIHQKEYERLVKNRKQFNGAI